MPSRESNSNHPQDWSWQDALFWVMIGASFLGVLYMLVALFDTAPPVFR